MACNGPPPCLRRPPRPRRQRRLRPLIPLHSGKILRLLTNSLARSFLFLLFLELPSSAESREGSAVRCGARGREGDLFSLQERNSSLVASAFIRESASRSTSDSAPPLRERQVTWPLFRLRIPVRRRRAADLSHGDEVDYANLTGVTAERGTVVDVLPLLLPLLLLLILMIIVTALSFRGRYAIVFQPSDQVSHLGIVPALHLPRRMCRLSLAIDTP